MQLGKLVVFLNSKAPFQDKFVHGNYVVKNIIKTNAHFQYGNIC